MTDLQKAEAEHEAALDEVWCAERSCGRLTRTIIRARERRDAAFRNLNRLKNLST